MRGIQRLGGYIPVSVRKPRKNKNTESLSCLCTSSGKIITKPLPESIAAAYAKAINTYYAPAEMQGLVRPYKGSVLIMMDIPVQIVPKSESRTITITPDGTQSARANRPYVLMLRQIRQNKEQYTTYKTVSTKITYPVWVEFVFHINTPKHATLADLCHTAADILADIGYVGRTYVVSLNNSRIIRDRTERTEVIVRELQERTK